MLYGYIYPYYTHNTYFTSQYRYSPARTRPLDKESSMSLTSRLSYLSAALLCSGALVPSLQAVEEAGSISDALSQGTTSLDLRLRLETVDEDGGAGSDLDAQALTLRMLLGYKTQAYKGWYGKLTFEHTAAIPDDEEYNSTTNGHADKAIIADPEESELDEAFLGYIGVEKNTFKIGRQVINHGNQRHVGAVAWRQNRQTFDALRVVNKSVDNLELEYAFVFNANRINTDEHPTAGDAPQMSHFVHGTYTLEDIGKATGYIYLLDFDKTGDDGSGSDSQTIGVSFNGKQALSDGMKLSYEVELAQQNDFGERDSLSAMYTHIRGGVVVNDIEFSLGMEILGSDDGNAAFQTPHATGHKFNGWADKFLGTPPDGLQDLYFRVGGKIKAIPGLNVKGIYHIFSGDDSGDDFGSEIDIVATYKFQDIENMSAGAKLAFYSEDGFATDTNKLWVWTGWKF